jgi:hypothetical protein
LLTDFSDLLTHIAISRGAFAPKTKTQWQSHQTLGYLLVQYHFAQHPPFIAGLCGHSGESVWEGILAHTQTNNPHLKQNKTKNSEKLTRNGHMTRQGVWAAILFELGLRLNWKFKV